MKTVIEMAREAGMVVVDDQYSLLPFLERFAELVRADEQKKWQDQAMVDIHEAVLDEREALIGLLKGIDKTESESADGWWETSSGAEVGAGILAAIRARSNT